MEHDSKTQLKESLIMADDSKSELEESAHDGKPDHGDIESGSRGEPLYPKMTEDPALRWAFIRKVYATLSIQFLFTAAMAVVGSTVKPIPTFFLTNTPTSWTVYFAILLTPLFVIWPMMRYRQRHPVNIFLLALFTICIGLSVGLSSALIGGRAVLQSAILTAAVLVGMTLYTFVAIRRGRDFTFLFPFLFCCFLVLFVYAIIQVFCPLGKVAHTIYGCLGTIVFSGFIIFDTNRLIKRHKYNEYVLAAISLYLDVTNLFMSTIPFSFSCR